MKKLMALILVTVSAGSAFASHPHDRICLSSSPLSFVFQYSAGRTYESGDPKQDSYKVAGEAYFSEGDYMDLPGQKYSSQPVVLGPKSSKNIAMQLKSSKGDVLFTGVFDVANEKLVGDFSDANGKTVRATSSLKCISQPRLTLESTEDDIVQ